VAVPAANNPRSEDELTSSIASIIAEISPIALQSAHTNMLGCVCSTLSELYVTRCTLNILLRSKVLVLKIHHTAHSTSVLSRQITGIPNTGPCYKKSLYIFGIRTRKWEVNHHQASFVTFQWISRKNVNLYFVSSIAHTFHRPIYELS
jgi:hypothetical protein